MALLFSTLSDKRVQIKGRFRFLRQTIILDSSVERAKVCACIYNLMHSVPSPDE